VGPEGLLGVDNDAIQYSFPGNIKLPLVSARLPSLTSIARLGVSNLSSPYACLFFCGTQICHYDRRWLGLVATENQHHRRHAFDGGLSRDVTRKRCRGIYEMCEVLTKYIQDAKRSVMRCVL
jgi:hypothetical protein